MTLTVLIGSKLGYQAAPWVPLTLETSVFGCFQESWNNKNSRVKQYAIQNGFYRWGSKPLDQPNKPVLEPRMRLRQGILMQSVHL